MNTEHTPRWPQHSGMVLEAMVEDMVASEAMAIGRVRRRREDLEREMNEEREREDRGRRRGFIRAAAENMHGAEKEERGWVVRVHGRTMGEGRVQRCMWRW